MQRLTCLLVVMGSWFTGTSSISFAQSSISPIINLSVSADNKPIDLAKGISAQTRNLTLSGSLAPESARLFPKGSTQVSIAQAEINLVRDNRRVGRLNWDSDQPLTSLTHQAQPGDRYLIRVNKVNLIAANGSAQQINKEIIYSVKLL